MIRGKGLPGGLAVLSWGWLTATVALAQGATPSPQGSPMASPLMPITSLEQLVRMSPPELEQLYAQSGPGAIPSGPVRGRAIPYPGTRLAVPASRVSRALWQGKVFLNQESKAVNRFFGLRIIRGQVFYGESWRDGGPAIILDYGQTSWLYANYRDEIREVAPGLYLGLMFDRTTCPQPTLKLYFALDARCRD